MSESSGDVPFIVSILPHKPLNVFSTDSRSSDTASESRSRRKQEHSQKKQEELEEGEQQQEKAKEKQQQQREKQGKDSGRDSVHWESAVLKKRPPPKWSSPIKLQPQITNASGPTPRVCNVLFPSSELFNEQTRNSLLSHTVSSSANWFFKTDSSKDGLFASAGGVLPQEAAVHLPSTTAPAAITTTATKHDVFKQSGGHVPRPEARVVHPQGFRILKDRSVIERSLRSYFRLPPAPSEHLKQGRKRTQRQLLAVEMREDAEDARFFGATMESSLQQPTIASGSMQPRLLLDGFMLLCAGGQPEPEAVEAVTLQSSHLVGVIKDDLTHFQNLRFLDLSENELLLEQLFPLMGLEVLHLAYNKINSLVGVARAVQEQQVQQKQDNSGNGNIFFNRSGVRCSASGTGPNATHNSTSIRSAAAYYAKEISAATMTSKTKTNTTITKSPPRERKRFYFEPIEQNSQESSMNGSSSDFIDGGAGYFSPHQKVTGPTQRPSDCSLHDVLLPNLHALNLSFNRIPPNDVLHLSYFPFLEKLDLSGNNLRVLPKDLAGLTCVTHFALERNHFSDGKSIFAALSTMPALIEVNLNHNELRRVPPLSVRDGHGLCFPTIEVIGLAHNRVESAQDVAALSELVRTLHRVVLAGNPISRKKKEQSAAQALFAQAVMNMYWEHAGMRTKGQGEFDSGNPFGTNTLGSMQSLPPHLNNNSNNNPRERQDAQEQHEWHQWRPGEDDMQVLDKGEEEEYHGLDSLIYSWRKQMESGRSLPNHTNFSLESGPLRYSDDDDSENDKDNKNEGVPHDATTTTSTSNEANTLSVSITKEDIPVIGNLFWYGDAVPPPSHGGIQPTGDNDKTALPPIPSLLRFVELVFDDAVMQKQKVGYFYAKRRQLMTEEEGGGDQQQGQTDLSRPSRMVHPKTGLVTVPNYTEFMDIYRLLDHSPQTRHRPRGKREYTTTRGKKKKQTADIVLPPEMEKDSDEDETNKEDDDIKPTTESAAVETTSQLQEGETDDYDDGEEEEAETSSCGSVSSRDVVFMTGVALEQEKSEKRRRKRRRKNEENKNEEENINQEKFVERDEIAPDIDIDRSKGHRMEEKSQRKSKKHQQYEGRSKEYASTNAKEDQHSTFEYEPPSTNVRILMNELRRMLRRPLPALPPLNTGRSINRGTKGL